MYIIICVGFLIKEDSISLLTFKNILKHQIIIINFLFGLKYFVIIFLIINQILFFTYCTSLSLDF